MMRILLLSIIMSLSMVFPVFGKDFKQLYHNELAQVQHLHQLATEYFKGPGSLKPGEVLTPEMVTDPKRQAQYYRIRRLVGLAIDAEIPLDFMAEFGLVKHEDSYEIRYKVHPQWADLSTLLARMKHTGSVGYIQHQLLAKGFSQIDIDKLNAYIADNNPQTMRYRQEQALVSKHQNEMEIQQAKGHNLPEFAQQEQIVQFGRRVHELKRKLRFDVANRWGHGLLNVLSKQKQHILMSSLVEGLGIIRIGAHPVDSQYFAMYGGNIIKGVEQQRLYSILEEQNGETQGELK